MIAGWFRRGVSEEKADYMIVVCDTFDYEDYPVYVSTDEFWKKHKEFDGNNMQRIMEVYDLKQPMAPQLELTRVYYTPPRIQ